MGTKRRNSVRSLPPWKVFKLRFPFYKLVEIRVLVEHRERGLSLFLSFRVAPGKPRQTKQAFLSTQST
jgi:hypothetical protein